MNPLSVARSELMKLSKIGSNNTYSKCMKDLHKWGYIEYLPSHDPFKGSKVNMFTFDTTTESTTESTTATALRPYININKQYKHLKQEPNKNKNYDEPL
jgi:hypothetical protein